MDLALIGFKSDTSGLTKAERGLDSLARKGVNAEKKLDRSTGAISMGFARIASVIATVITTATGLTKLVSITREFDVLNAQLITATGSAEKATDAFGAIQEFAKTTPYDLAQATTAFNKLVNLGLNPSQRALVSYGDTASAMGKSLDQFIEAVADAATAEFERLKEFGIRAKNQGDTIDFTFRGVKTSVKNNAEEIENYLISLGENNFAGSMANRMATLDGAISNLGDSWDQLFLTISQAGSGALIEDGVRTATSAIDELTEALASGEVGERVDAFMNKFSGFGEDIAWMLDTVGSLWTQGTKNWYTDADASLSLITGAFKNLPENIRALIQIITVELATLVDVGTEYTMLLGRAIGVQLAHLPVVAKANIQAFGQILGTELAKYVDMAGSYGEELLDKLNPFDGDTFNLDEALAQAQALAGNMTATYISEAEKQVAASATLKEELIQSYVDTANAKIEASANARKATLADIVTERDTAVKSFDSQVDGAKNLTKEYKKMMAERKKANKDVLGSFKIKKETEHVEEQDKALDKLIDKVYGLGDAWAQSNNVIVDSFGDMADVLSNYTNELTKIGKMEEQLAAERLEHKDDPNYLKAIGKAEEELAGRRTKANLSSFGAIAGAASQMFDEQSKEREALHKMETIFTAAEIAMSLQKAGANALTAISAAFAAPWPIGFASGAAMIAIMAGLGLFGGSGGTGPGQSASDIQATQGRGTLLGSDEQSASIADSMDRYEDIQIDQLHELQGIRNNIRTLSSGIKQLATSVVSGVGLGAENYGGQLGEFSTTSKLENFLITGGIGGLDPTGIISTIAAGFSKTKKTLIDSGITFFSQTLGDILESGSVEAAVYAEIQTTKKKWWGLSKSTSSETTLTDLDSSIAGQMGKIFGHIGTSVIDAANLLGINTVEVTQTSTQGIWDRIGELDLWGGRIPGRFTDMLTETLTTTTEMTLEDALNNFTIDLPKISLEGLSGDEIQQELEAVFSQQADLIAEYLVPSIKQYQQIGEGSYETLLRVAQEQVIFNDHLERTGMVLGELSTGALIDVSQGVINLMGGLENFQDAANDYFNAFFTEEEKFNYLQKSLTDVMGDLNMQLPTSRQGFRDLVESLDLTTEEGQSTYAMLMQIVPAMDDYISQLEDQNGALMDYNEIAREALSNLRESVDMEKQRASEGLKASQELYNSEIQFINLQRDAINSVLSMANQSKSRLDESIDAEKDKLATGLTEKLGYIQTEKDFAAQLHKDKLDSISQQKSASQRSHSALMKNYSTQMSVVSKSVSSLRNLSNNLKKSLESLQGVTSGSGALAQLDEAINKAKAGDFTFDISGAMQYFGGNQSQDYSSLTEMLRESTQAQLKLVELSDITDSQLSVEEKTLSQLESSEASAERRHTSIMSAYDYQVTVANKQYDLMVEALEAQAADAQAQHDESVDNLDKISEEAQAQLDALTGVDTTTLDVVDAISEFNDALTQATFDNAEIEFAKLDALEVSAREDLALSEQFYEAEIERLDQLVADQESQLNALLGIDTSIMSVEDAINSLSVAMGNIRARTDVNPAKPFKLEDTQYTQPKVPSPETLDVKQEVIKLNESQSITNRALVKHNSRMANILQRIELNGLDTYAQTS